MRVYHCLTCSDHPRFERDQAIAHLAEHGIGVNVVARRDRLGGFDGLKSFTEIYIWTYANWTRLQETVYSVRPLGRLPCPSKPTMEVSR